MLIWATGNKLVPLVDKLNLRKTEEGSIRILTDDCLNAFALDGSAMQNVFAMGDAVDIEGGTLPTTAEVAIQKSDYIINVLNNNDKFPLSLQAALSSHLHWETGWCSLGETGVHGLWSVAELEIWQFLLDSVMAEENLDVLCMVHGLAGRMRDYS